MSQHCNSQYLILDKGGKKEKTQPVAVDDDGPISYHGIAYVDLAPLLYPGVCRVAGAFRIHPFNEVEMMEKVFWHLIDLTLWFSLRT